MLQAIAIGHIGRDAECKSANGREFTTFRIAHTDRWTDDAQQVHEETTWIDVIINGRPNVLPYLRKGQQVFVSGNMSVRVYSSAKDRCMKAGMTINARQIELLGSKGDDIPAQLFDANSGAIHEVKKWFNVPSLVRDEQQPEFIPMVSKSQERFVVDRNGWVSKFEGED